MLDELDPHQKPAIGAALDAQPARAGDLARDQVLGHGRKVVEDALGMGFSAPPRASRPEFAAAADVGQHKDPAAF